ncbi:hypothetical protein NPIL_400821 [Nephila pilipes]|uniref:Uncharacterized protein n=1 Tax=Nephila pilipes TaxID=299642 RepID=A0A8X6N8C9_NEPPI|nr:hypothetical protein NPIL_400821 [Nephila pilipes]
MRRFTICLLLGGDCSLITEQDPLSKSRIILVYSVRRTMLYIKNILRVIQVKRKKQLQFEEEPQGLKFDFSSRCQLRFSCSKYGGLHDLGGPTRRILSRRASPILSRVTLPSS